MKPLKMCNHELVTQKQSLSVATGKADIASLVAFLVLPPPTTPPTAPSAYGRNGLAIVASASADAWLITPCIATWRNPFLPPVPNCWSVVPSRQWPSSSARVALGSFCKQGVATPPLLHLHRALPQRHTKRKDETA